ncbi:Gti1/Pac2 family-domain-containing protein [Halteromyces radiatus]|uniref:Gti1/Pac2 family-domain-containing protein n=1 Tax=Halteromyces radiatus TaxID=101107 RepID=UPI00221EB1C7|nr:Gti1/Pac2 family-domain-containing protein [Halteromyces radiatus]KAI8093319.1 Gti1/Pac2 family-domain-containing protein [Halteromyces radiatus]
MSIVETFHGYIETTQDSLLVLEACRRCLLPKISRRLQEKERKLVRSGSVFVFDEKDSGIKRWTDGLVWSPSRILGNFLIYRELDKRIPKRKRTLVDPSRNRLRSNSADQSVSDRHKERQLVGSLSEAYNYKEDGLIKKTMSLIVDGTPLHLISYYHPDDVLARKLRTPSAVPELVNLEISPELLVRQNFRIPPVVEPDHYPQQPYYQTSSSSSSGFTAGNLYLFIYYYYYYKLVIYYIFFCHFISRWSACQINFKKSFTSF